MGKKTIWGLVILVVVILIILIGRGNNSSGSPKIGVVAPLTGWGAYWGEGYVKGMQLAQDEIKAGGDNLDIAIEDGATDAQKSATAAQKLINIDKVNALAVEFTAPSSSVNPLSLSNKIPFVYDALVKKFVEDNPYAFKFYFDVGKQCAVATEYLASQGYKNIGGLFLNLDFAPECEQAMTKVAQEKGIKIDITKFNIDTTDFRTIISKMKSSGIDALVPVFYEDHAISFFKQKADLGLRIPIFMGIGIPDGFTEKVRSSVPQSAIEGVMTFDQPISDDFRAKLARKYPGIVEKDFVPAAYGYDEVMYLYNGLSKCSKTDPDCVVSKMKQDAHVGVLQSAGFGDDRVLDMSPVYYRYTSGKLVEFNP
ncbi:MAG: ABC transporter substrate-binding protein [Candidatus Pacebacteria bacterium]|nr:ABC transporter substrate-binding protein [Candidatus Paceibacterota bacterium]MDD5357234.1 ABC transporter substrate-binding protein [Candidatus Paceibacterota bacterium]